MAKGKFKKIALVKPPERSTLNFGTFSLAVIAAAARDIVDISIVDTTNLSVDRAVKEVMETEPDLIGITLMGAESVPFAISLVRALKGARNTSTIIAGGHGAVLLPRDLLNAGVDCCVLGEGESTFRDILERGIVTGMPGTVTMKENREVKGPPRPLIFPLDRLELPARDLMPPPPEGVYLMETSRGCPHQCKFCETTRFYGRRWRPFSPERVVREAKLLMDKYNAWIIHFADDNFSASIKRVKKICEQIIEEEVFPAFYMLSARADDLVSDPDLLPLMAKARMLRISVGVETLAADVAREIDKPIPFDVYKQAFTRMRELGIFSVASLILGLPGETPQDRARTVELAVEAGPDSAHFLPFQPQAGLPLKGKHDGYDLDPDDLRDAVAFESAFFNHPTVQTRLKTLAELDGIQAMLARSTLNNPVHKKGSAGTG
jgi:anaerobic magnesium-protoporphyrin IX monomethyl ester cyclase